MIKNMTMNLATRLEERHLNFENEKNGQDNSLVDAAEAPITNAGKAGIERVKVLSLVCNRTGNAHRTNCTLLPSLLLMMLFGSRTPGHWPVYQEEVKELKIESIWFYPVVCRKVTHP